MKTTPPKVTAKKFRKDPRMPQLHEEICYPRSKTQLATLYNKIGAELRVVNLGKRDLDELPPIIMWEWRAYRQDLSSTESLNYHEVDCHHVWT